VDSDHFEIEDEGSDVDPFDTFRMLLGPVSEGRVLKFVSKPVEKAAIDAEGEEPAEAGNEGVDVGLEDSGNDHLREVGNGLDGAHKGDERAEVECVLPEGLDDPQCDGKDEDGPQVGEVEEGEVPESKEALLVVAGDVGVGGQVATQVALKRMRRSWQRRQVRASWMAQTAQVESAQAAHCPVSWLGAEPGGQVAKQAPSKANCLLRQVVQ